MKSFNRRQFLSTLGPLTLMAFRKQSPDLVLHHANIITVNPRQPRAQAVAIVGDRIMAVGSNDEILRLATASTKKLDMGGSTRPDLLMRIRIRPIQEEPTCAT